MGLKDLFSLGQSVHQGVTDGAFNEGLEAAAQECYREAHILRRREQFHQAERFERVADRIRAAKR